MHFGVYLEKMKIYTKTGDKGTTSLVGGSRVSKYDLRLHAYGTTDELNSWVGLIADTCNNSEVTDFLRNIQVELFNIGSNLASEDDQTRVKLPQVTNNAIELLENAIDEMNKELPSLRTFILPGGHQVVSYCHLARTVCRRAERWVVELSEKNEVRTEITKYFNRLSDYFFVLSRYLGKQFQVAEIAWNPTK